MDWKTMLAYVTGSVNEEIRVCAATWISGTLCAPAG